MGIFLDGLFDWNRDGKLSTFERGMQFAFFASMMDELNRNHTEDDDDFDDFDDFDEDDPDNENWDDENWDDEY